MKTFHYIIRTNDGNARPVLAEGDVEASRAAVAAKRAAESIPDRPKVGEWFHVSLQRVQ